jgi:alpha-L-fucosidase 2
LSKAATIQLSLIRDIFDIVIRASQILNIDDDYSDELKKMIDRLYPYEMDSQGLLKEYAEDFPLPFPGHRHMSHLYGVFPAYDRAIMNCPQLLEAAKKSLNHRWESGWDQTGWNLGWTITLFARMQDKENAYKALVQMLASATLPNLFDNHPPFQIDGNFGGVAGIAEMLLQSHTDEIVLLPALPDAWKDGSVKGLLARGGLEVSMKWRDSQIEEIELAASSTNTFQIRFPGKHRLAQTFINGDVRSFDSTEALEIALKAGDRICMKNFEFF